MESNNLASSESTVLSEITQLLKCTQKQVEYLLNHTIFRQKVYSSLVGREFHCPYKRSTNFVAQSPSKLKFGGLTFDGANKLFAFNGLYGITVQQYFFAKYKIHLKYPHLPCVIMYGGGGHKSYYPMELITLVGNTSQQSEMVGDNGSKDAQPMMVKNDDGVCYSNNANDSWTFAKMAEEFDKLWN